jgi:hypothetical protein
MIVHEHSDRVYIGQTTKSVEKRWRAHCHASSGCLKLKHALGKYTPEAFGVYELAVFATRAEADDVERMLITMYRSTEQKRGFNITSGGKGNARTVCKRGHALDDANRTTMGACKICSRETRKAWVLRNKHKRAQYDARRWAKVKADPARLAEFYEKAKAWRQTKTSPLFNELGQRIKKAQCVNGHDRTAANAVRPGSFSCIACERERLKRNRAAA